MPRSSPPLPLPCCPWHTLVSPSEVLLSCPHRSTPATPEQRSLLPRHCENASLLLPETHFPQRRSGTLFVRGSNGVIVLLRSNGGSHHLPTGDAASVLGSSGPHRSSWRGTPTGASSKSLELPLGASHSYASFLPSLSQWEVPTVPRASCRLLTSQSFPPCFQGQMAPAA